MHLIWGRGLAFSLGLLLALGAGRPALAQGRPAASQDAAQEAEMMHQQLARAHAGRDQIDREMAAAFVKMQNDNEAQKATLIEWLTLAQASALVATGTACMPLSQGLPHHAPK